MCQGQSKSRTKISLPILGKFDMNQQTLNIKYELNKNKIKTRKKEDQIKTKTKKTNDV